MQRLTLILMLILLLGVAGLAEESAGEDPCARAMFPVKVWGRWGFIDREGAIVVEPRFEFARFSPDGFACAQLGGLWGIVGFDGEWTARPEYQSLLPVNEGLFRFSISTADGPRYGLINSSGAQVLPPRYEKIGDFGEGLCCTLRGGRFALMDAEGWEVTEPPGWAGRFSEGLAPCFIGGRWGYIDREGKVAIEPRFTHAEAFIDGWAAVEEGGTIYDPLTELRSRTIQAGGRYFIDKTGARVSGWKDGMLTIKGDGGLYVCIEEDRYGYTNRSGEWIIQPKFEYASGFVDGIAPVLTGDGLVAIIGLDGEKLVEKRLDAYTEYTFVMPFTCGLSRVYLQETDAILTADFELIDTPGMRQVVASSFGYLTGRHAKSDRLYLLDSRGQVLARTDFHEIHPLSDKLVAITWDHGNSYGIARLDGSVVVHPRFSAFHVFSEGLLAVRGVTWWGYVNPAGEWVIEPRFSYALPFSDGLAAVYVGGKWGYIDHAGELVIESCFDKADSFSQGLAAVQLNGKWGYISPKGIMLIEPRYEQADSFNEGLALVKGEKGWGYVNRLGVEVIKPVLQSATPFHDGLAIVASHPASTEIQTHPLPVFPKAGWSFRAIDTLGRTVTEEFACIGEFRNGLAPALPLGADPEEGWEYIDTEGRIVTDLHLARAGYFFSDFAWVRVPARNGYIDAEAGFVWPPSW